MKHVLQKKDLANGYYYSGYILQHCTFIGDDQPMIVGMWDKDNNSFVFWDYDGNLKIKRKLSYLSDIDNDIEEGFVPIRVTIPTEKHVID